MGKGSWKGGDATATKRTKSTIVHIISSFFESSTREIIERKVVIENYTVKKVKGGKVTMDQLASHNVQEDAWMAIKGKVCSETTTYTTQMHIYLFSVFRVYTNDERTTCTAANK